MSYTRMTIKPRMKWYKKTIIVLVIVSAGIFYVGRWLPQFLVLDEGISFQYKPKNIFSCLLNSQAAKGAGQPLKTGAVFNLLLEIFPEGEVTDFVKDDYIILTDSGGSSLTITIEDEGGSYWLSFIFEQDLGENPLNRILENWRRKNKEKSIVKFLSDFSTNETARCSKTDKRNLLNEEKTKEVLPRSI